MFYFRATSLVLGIETSLGGEEHSLRYFQQELSLNNFFWCKMELAKQLVHSGFTGWLSQLRKWNLCKQVDSSQTRAVHVCLLDQLLLVGLDSMNPMPRARAPLAQPTEAEFLNTKLWTLSGSVKYWYLWVSIWNFQSDFLSCKNMYI